MKTSRLVTAVALFLCGLTEAYAAEMDSGRLVRDAVGVARELRQSDNTFDQLSAAGILVEIGDKESLQFLADNLGHDDWSLMRSAIDTLLTVQHPAGLDVIYRYAALTEDPIFMKFLAEGCASNPRDDMAEFLMEALKVDDSWVKKHALQALVDTELENKEARMRAIAENLDNDSTTRAYAWYALMDTPSRDDSLAMMLEIADGWAPEAQEAAAVALGTVDTEINRAALHKLRTADTYKVQVAAMTSEAGYGLAEAKEDLVRTIATGKGLDPAVAAASVRRLPPAMAEQVTHELLTCCPLNSDVGTRLLESWGTIEGNATEVLDWGLANENPDIRMQAAWLVGRRGAQQYLDQLGTMLKDSDSGIRAMAAWSIVRILGDEFDEGVEI